MTLRHIGTDPDSPQNGSPKVWIDDGDGSIVLQGWRLTDPVTIAEVGEIPAHETTLRLPGRMAPFLQEVCDALRNDLRRPTGQL